jgi:hypothetical protein
MAINKRRVKEIGLCSQKSGGFAKGVAKAIRSSRST